MNKFETQNELMGALEAMLFVNDDPVGSLKLAEILNASVEEVESALAALAQDYNARKSGLTLKRVAGGWKLYTREAYHDIVQNYVISWDTRRMTQAAIEVLAIIAYNQPITRLGISSIRGVISDSSVVTLMEKGFVREIGVAQTPGNPVLYGTTRAFLEKFGLASLEELPELTQFAPDEESKKLIMSRLGAKTGYYADEEGVSEESQERLLERVRLDEDEEREAVSSALGAFASAVFGTVEKINFDELSFDNVNTEEE
ncbi:MAG: SMC-Scp complex subunit ScpB [Eggerthellaceae bacterium]|nr:SMC-Scp complex subunit ScpB [Eggerthellaceae bacterium]